MRTWRLDELAAFLGSEARGEPSKMLTGACTIEKPENASVSFAQNKSQLESARRLVSNELGALIQPSNVEPLYETVILHDNPRLAFAWTQIAFHAPNWVELPPKAPMHDTSPIPLVGGEWRKPFGIDEKAKVSDGAIIAGDVEIGAFSIIEDGASLGEGAIIYPHVYIGKGVRIGRNCRVFPHVTIYAHSQIGDGVYIHSGTVIGADGFGFVSHDHGHTKLAQTGRVVIGDNVEIGANCCIDRAAIGDTVIEDGVKLDNLIQVAHGVRIGANTLVAAQAGFSGGMDIGKWCVIGGQAGFAGHASVGDCSIVAARAGVMGGLPAKSKVSGYPARPHKEQLRVIALTYRLPELFDQVKELKSKVSAMEDVNAVSNNRTDGQADGQAEDSNGAIYDGQDGVRDVDS